MKYTFSKIHIYRCLPPYSKWYSITTDSGITKDNIVIVGKKRLLKVAFALILMVLFKAIRLTKRNIKCNRRLAKKFLKKARFILNKNREAFGIKFQGKCLASTCPLGYLADKDDIIRFGEDPELMAVDDWLVIENNE